MSRLLGQSGPRGGSADCRGILLMAAATLWPVIPLVVLLWLVLRHGGW